MFGSFQLSTYQDRHARLALESLDAAEVQLGHVWRLERLLGILLMSGLALLSIPLLSLSLRGSVHRFKRLGLCLGFVEQGRT